MKYQFRRLIRDAFKAVDPSSKAPSIRSRDFDAWRIYLDEIAEHLVWDHDFLGEAVYADLDPDRAEFMKKRARIEDGYFSTPPPLVREEDYREADRFLRRVAGCPKLLDPWAQGGR